MRVASFEVRGERSVAFARCDQVPPLMIIAGPNGSGKSTVLNSIRKQGGYTNIMYEGPHRSMLRQTVQQRHLLSGRLSLEDLLARPDIQNYDGVQTLGGTRDPWSYDSSSNYFKHALCQIEVERQQAIASRFDRDGEIRKDAIRDAWKPLRELATNLLPHLTFHGIDASNPMGVRCLFRVHGAETLVDLDDLSSGEKSILQMFYPIVERDIRALLQDVSGGTHPVARPEQCVLIDEPELHLHPNLQLKVIDYLRVLTSGTGVQVIVATHSTTIVEYASFEELFVLRPVELVATGDNQLTQLATDEDRLRTLRGLFGTTSNLTSLQPIVVVEGVTEAGTSRSLADRKIYRALHPGFDRVTVLAGGGKSECVSLVKTLRGDIQLFSSKLTAVGLLDNDGQGSSPDPNITLLPVAMIENLLLDPDSIWEAIQSVVEKTSLNTIDDLSAALDHVLDELDAEEVEIRTIRGLGTVNFRPKRPVSEVPAAAEAFCNDVTGRFSSSAVTTARSASEAAVDGFKASHRRREEYHGKNVINKFFKDYLRETGMSKAVFLFETARHARRRKAVVQFFETFFSSL